MFVCFLLSGRACVACDCGLLCGSCDWCCADLPHNFSDPNFGTPNEYYPTYNFDGILFAIYTVFQIISLENWNNAMYYCWYGLGQAPAQLFFYTVILLGNYVFLNLFIAIILSSFDGLNEATKREELKQVRRNAAEAAALERDRLSRGGASVWSPYEIWSKVKRVRVQAGSPV